jgi:hypothetical protein
MLPILWALREHALTYGKVTGNPRVIGAAAVACGGSFAPLLMAVMSGKNADLLNEMAVGTVPNRSPPPKAKALSKP